MDTRDPLRLGESKLRIVADLEMEGEERLRGLRTSLREGSNDVIRLFFRAPRSGF